MKKEKKKLYHFHYEIIAEMCFRIALQLIKQGAEIWELASVMALLSELLSSDRRKQDKARISGKCCALAADFAGRGVEGRAKCFIDIKCETAISEHSVQLLQKCALLI